MYKQEVCFSEDFLGLVFLLLCLSKNQEIYLFMVTPIHIAFQLPILRLVLSHCFLP